MKTPANNPLQSKNSPSQLGELHGVDPSTAESLRALTARELFVAEFNIVPLGEHAVSLVLPAELSPLQFILRAQEMLRVEGQYHELILPFQRDMWKDCALMTTPLTEKCRIAIDGHVEGTAGVGHSTRSSLLRNLGLSAPRLEDLAVAHAAFYMATGKDLFRGHVTDTASGALFLYSGGLSEAVWMGCVVEHYPYASAAYLPS